MNSNTSNPDEAENSTGKSMKKNMALLNQL